MLWYETRFWAICAVDLLKQRHFAYRRRGRMVGSLVATAANARYAGEPSMSIEL
jgi:hypothetical protein